MTPAAPRSRRPVGPPDRPLTAKERGWLVLGLAVALAVRLAHLAVATPAPVSSDASGYDAAARRLVATGSYAFPIGIHLWSEDVVREDSLPAFYRMPANAWAMPGYTWFVAGVYRGFGTGPGRFVPVRVIQAVLSVVTVALCFAIARQLLDARAAWITLGLVALFPSGVWATGYLLTETLFTLLLTAQVALMVRAWRSRTLATYALLGVTTAAAVYVRPVAVVVPGLLLVLELWRAWRTPRAGPSPGALAVRYATVALVVVALLAPWALRNQRQYGTFMPTTSAAVLPPLQGELYVRGIYLKETFAQYADLGLAGNDDHRFAIRVAALIRSLLPPASAGDQLRYQVHRLSLLARALATPFAFPETSVSEMPWGAALNLALVLLALAGWWLHRRDGPVAVLLGGVPVYFVVIHWAITSLWPRYLYPASPFALILVAAALAAWTRPRRRARAVGAVQ